MNTEKPMPGDVRMSRLRAAGEWLLRMQDASRTDADIDEWLRWCAADPENRVEFEKVQGDWRDLDALRASALAEPPSQSSANDDIRVGNAGKTRLLNKENGERIPPIRAAEQRYLARIALAAAACVAALAVTALWVRDRQAPVPQGSQQIAATDMNRAATLPDGSRVILRPESTLLVRYIAAHRDLDLVAGEAYFKVKHDKSHPFVVHAGDIHVTAVGTAFDVRRKDGRMTVTVEEGIVKVTSDTWASKGLPASWLVKAGDQFTYSDPRRAEVIASVNVGSSLRWREGELAYVREPLGSVADDLNRYSARKIVIEDPAVARLLFTGTAFTDSLSDWLKAIQQVYPVEVKDDPDGDIVITSRRSQVTTPSAH